MTTFKAPHNHRTLTIKQHADGSGITFHAKDEPAIAGVYLDPTDAPAIALAVLEAAGVVPRDLTGWTRGRADHLSKIAFDLTEHVRCAQVFAAAAAEEAARGKRRDELAAELMQRAGSPTTEDWTYEGLYDDVAKAAVDMLIDAEQELGKERAK